VLAVEGEFDGEGSGAVVVVVVVLVVVVAVFAGVVFSVWLAQPAAINAQAKARPTPAALKKIFISDYSSLINSRETFRAK
jgi:flagellar basal body-associated protein FliL